MFKLVNIVEIGSSHISPILYSQTLRFSDAVKLVFSKRLTFLGNGVRLILLSHTDL